MKPNKVALVLAVFVLWVLVGNLLNAQSTTLKSKPRHSKYKLIDLGTLGGPNSFFNRGPPAVINNRGMIGAEADTAEPCSYFDGFVSPAVTWHNDELINLGLLPGGCFSLPNAVNSKGVLVGSGDIGVIDPIAGVPEIRADLRYRGKILDLGTFGGPTAWPIRLTMQLRSLEVLRIRKQIRGISETY